MKAYELIIVVRPDFSEADIDSLIGDIEGKITASGGAVERIEGWGKRKLQSPFKKFKGLTDVLYFVVSFKSDPSFPAVLQNMLRINENVLRFSISLAVGIAPPPEAVAAAPAGVAGEKEELKVDISPEMLEGTGTQK